MQIGEYLGEATIGDFAYGPLRDTPVEIFYIIAEHAYSADIYNMSIACKFFNAVVNRLRSHVQPRIKNH